MSIAWYPFLALGASVVIAPIAARFGKRHGRRANQAPGPVLSDTEETTAPTGQAGDER